MGEAKSWRELSRKPYIQHANLQNIPDQSIQYEEPYTIAIRAVGIGNFISNEIPANFLPTAEKPILSGL